MDEKLDITYDEALSECRFNGVVFMIYCLDLISYKEYTEFTWPIFHEGTVNGINGISRKFGREKFKELLEIYDRNQEWMVDLYFSSPLTFSGYFGPIPAGANREQYIQMDLEQAKQKFIDKWLDEGNDIEFLINILYNDD